MAGFETKTAMAFAQVKAAIESGKIRPGDRVRLREWAVKLDVSPTPLREALKALESEGYITISPHRGARVVPFSEKDFFAASRLTRTSDSLAAELTVASQDA